MPRIASIIIAFSQAMQNVFLAALTLMLLGGALSPPASAQEAQVFHNPTIRGMPVDRCLHYGTDCEEPAASAFCRRQGYSGAISWRWEYTSPTFVLGDGNVCTVSCGGFYRIICE